MPSEKILEMKKQQVAALRERLTGACAGVLVDYKGITVADDTALRRELREAGVEYTVLKNSLIRLAIEGTSLAGMGEALKGSTAVATSQNDYVAAARILGKFAGKIKNFTMKSGFLDEDVIGLEKLTELSKLPSRRVLLATVLSAFNAPLAAFARAIQAVVDKRAGEPPAEEAVKAEAAAEEAPKAKAPAEAPKAEEPAEETPKPRAAKPKAPRAEEPAGETPKPRAAKPKAAKPKAEVPAEEPKAE